MLSLFVTMSMLFVISLVVYPVLPYSYKTYETSSMTAVVYVIATQGHRYPPVGNIMDFVTIFSCLKSRWSS
jgi:hypothetical protein